MDNFTLPPGGRLPTTRASDFFAALEPLRATAYDERSRIVPLLDRAEQDWGKGVKARGLLTSDADADAFLSLVQLQTLVAFASAVEGPGLDTLLRSGVSSPYGLTRIVVEAGRRALGARAIRPVAPVTLSAAPMEGMPLENWRAALDALRDDGHPVSWDWILFGGYAGDVRLTLALGGDSPPLLRVRGIHGEMLWTHREPLTDEGMRALAALFGGLWALALLPLPEERRVAGSTILRSEIAGFLLEGGEPRDAVGRAVVQLRLSTTPEERGPERPFWPDAYFGVVSAVDAFAGFRPEPLTGHASRVRLVG